MIGRGGIGSKPRNFTTTNITSLTGRSDIPLQRPRTASGVHSLDQLTHASGNLQTIRFVGRGGSGSKGRDTPSLANSFDVKDPQDFLRGLTNALNEYDQSRDEGDRTKMVATLQTLRTVASAEHNSIAFHLQTFTTKTTPKRPDGLHNILHRPFRDIISSNTPRRTSNLPPRVPVNSPDPTSPFVAIPTRLPSNAPITT